MGDVASFVYRMFAHFDAYEPASFLYPAGFAESSRSIETWIGFVNTLVLVTSSFTVATGLHFASRGDGRRTALCRDSYVEFCRVANGLPNLHAIVGTSLDDYPPAARDFAPGGRRQSSRRFSSDFVMVTSSANSRSLPTGTPMAMRVTFNPSGLSRRAR